MSFLRSSLSDFKAGFEKSITARDVAEPLCSFDEIQSALLVSAVMRDKDYDVVGVRNGGTVVGYVLRDDLSGGQLRDHMKLIEEADVSGENYSLGVIVKSLHPKRFVFVRILGQIGGIITTGDLQKTPVRMWLFGLISLLEMQMLRLVREGYSNDLWTSLITRERLQSAQNLLRIRRQRNEALDLADCLQFADKVRILSKSPALIELFGRDNKRTFRDRMKRFEELRNDLAHSQDIVRGRWPKIVSMVSELEEAIEVLEHA